MGKQKEKMMQATNKINGILKKQTKTKQLKEVYSGWQSVGKKSRASSVKRSSEGPKRALNKS